MQDRGAALELHTAPCRENESEEMDESPEDAHSRLWFTQEVPEARVFGAPFCSARVLSSSVLKRVLEENQ